MTIKEQLDRLRVALADFSECEYGECNALAETARELQLMLDDMFHAESLPPGNSSD